MWLAGLNPYGLTYTLGLQGAGTPRANPRPAGLDGFLNLAAEIGARCVELDGRWLVDRPDDDLKRIGERVAAMGAVALVSHGLSHRPDETLAGPIRAACGVGARILRMHLSPVLEGARAAAGARWPTLVAHARAVLTRDAPRAAEAGLRLGIEDHQDFGSEELVAFAEEAGPNVGVVFDTGNPFAVGEDPVAFARRASHRICHIHLKDYRAQFTAEGYRLVRCAIGDGCVPFTELAGIVGTGETPITASLEPAALEARHIRAFTPDWWRDYPPRTAAEFATAVGRLEHCRLPSDADVRTPWESGAESAAIVAYERDQLERSARFARNMGWL